MIRVLFISNYSKNTGGINQQVLLLKELTRKEIGFSANIFSTKAGNFKRLVLFFNLCYIGRKYDVFHIHGCSYRGFLPIVYGTIVGSILRKKIIVTYHGGDADIFLTKRAFLTKSLLSKSHSLTVPSLYLLKIFKKHGFDVEYIPNIIDPGKVGFKIKETIKPSFISIRSLEPLYNIKLIINAFYIIQKSFPDASLVILGDGSQKKELYEYVQKNSIKNIKLPGQVPSEEVFSYLAEADILINSPIIDNMPVSLLEAFASGVLVISSNVGGIPNIIINRKNGLLFQSNNIDDLVDKIKDALENQKQSKVIISNAYEMVGEYSWNTIKAKLLNLYKFR